MRSATAFSSCIAAVVACDSCFGPQDLVTHTRLSRRMQPGAPGASYGPTRDLEWGQLNFLHTTDTHGWLEGHIKEQNYGADWGDFVSFSTHMQHKAGNLGVDLLLVDTGDLHDGNGLSDATLPDGVDSNPVFNNVKYDLLTIGNHELYLATTAYETSANFSKVWGDKYLTSNVQIINPATGSFEYIGAQYRYFTTPHGLRVMAFGVLYDFTGNTNVTKVIKGADMIKQAWFTNAVKYSQPIDIFVLLGHNPVRGTSGGGTLPTIYKAIRSARPDVPIQAFGGHTHIRDFVAYDSMSTALESGRYCETLGWLSMSGINSTTYTGVQNPRGVPNPTRRAKNATTSALVYSRRYMDWNRLTFEYHAVGSQVKDFNLHSGLRVTSEIADIRKQLNLTMPYGCAPQTWCLNCAPYGSNESIFSLVPTALGATVINASRSAIPRLIIINTGSVRFDLLKGLFTYDDSFIVSPFTDGFQYLPNVPYKVASQVLGHYNKQKKRSTNMFESNVIPGQEGCVDPIFGPLTTQLTARNMRGVHRSRATTLVPGYTTKDDFGTDGDDTAHSIIPYYPMPDYAQAQGGFPTDGSMPATVDLIFLDFIASGVISILNGLGQSYTTADVSYYMPKDGPNAFTIENYLPAYAQLAWQANLGNCSVA